MWIYLQGVLYFFNRNKYFYTRIDNRKRRNGESRNWSDTDDSGEETESEEEELNNSNNKEDQNFINQYLPDQISDAKDKESDFELLAEVNERGYKNEQGILKATSHSQNASGLCTFVNDYIDLARSVTKNEVSWCQHTNIFIVYYAQYMYLPFLARNNQVILVILFHVM